MVGDPVSCDTLAADSGVLTQFMDSPSDSAPTLSPSIVASPQTPPAPPTPLELAPIGLRLDLTTQGNLLNGINRRSNTLVSFIHFLLNSKELLHHIILISLNFLLYHRVISASNIVKLSAWVWSAGELFMHLSYCRKVYGPLRRTEIYYYISLRL